MKLFSSIDNQQKGKPSMPSNKFALKAFSFYEKIYIFYEKNGTKMKKFS